MKKISIYPIEFVDLSFYLLRNNIQFFIYDIEGRSMKYEDVPRTAKIKNLTIENDKMHIQIIY